MRLIIGSALALAFVVGCQKEEEPAPAAPQAKAPVVKGNPRKHLGKDVISGVARRMDIIEVHNLMKQLGLAYNTFETLNNRGPKSIAELEDSLGKSGTLLEPLKNGDITVIYGARRAQIAADKILAYETYADGHGIRVVLMGDGSIQELTEAEFGAAPKAIGTK